MNESISETKDIVVSSRVRLARNLSAYPFPTQIKNETISNEIIKKIDKEVSRLDQFKLFKIQNLSETDAECLKEKHLISQNLIENFRHSAVLINQDENISIMINEEDHIRAQCLLKGFNLQNAYNKIDKIDDVISSKLNIAFSKELGFLTACPTNLGTGMRASVMLFLPALTLSGDMDRITSSAIKQGLTFRGIYGEGSEAEGYMYQVSNQVTLGVLESDIIRSVEYAVKKICEAENIAKIRLFEENKIEIMDKVKRAYGILVNCYKINTNEFMSLVSTVKLGASLGILKFKENSLIDDLIVSVRPAHINSMARQDLTAEERDIYRAEYISHAFEKII